jgi:hypothetical protein
VTGEGRQEFIARLLQYAAGAVLAEFLEDVGHQRARIQVASSVGTARTLSVCGRPGAARKPSAARASACSSARSASRADTDSGSGTSSGWLRMPAPSWASFSRS